MKSAITKRCIEIVNWIKDNRHIPSSRQLCKIIDVHPQCLSDILTGKREVNIDLISKLVEHFDINSQYLFTGIGDLLIDADDRSRLSTVTQPMDTYSINYIPSLEVNSDKDLPSKVGEQLVSLPFYNLDPTRNTVFEILEDNMYPSLTTGDKVIAKRVELDKVYNKVRKNYVYVIVTDQNIMCRRVLITEISDEIALLSDNNFYDPEHVKISSIKELWEVQYCIGRFSPSETMNNKNLVVEMDNLRMTISDQGQMIKSLNSTIEKLLKQNRVMSMR